MAEFDQPSGVDDVPRFFLRLVDRGKQSQVLDQMILTLGSWEGVVEEEEGREEKDIQLELEAEHITISLLECQICKQFSNNSSGVLHINKKV